MRSTIGLGSCVGSLGAGSICCSTVYICIQVLRVVQGTGCQAGSNRQGMQGKRLRSPVGCCTLVRLATDSVEFLARYKGMKPETVNPHCRQLCHSRQQASAARCQYLSDWHEL